MKTGGEIELFCNEFASSLATKTLEPSQMCVETTAEDAQRVYNIMSHLMRDHHGIELDMKVKYDMNNRGFVFIDAPHFVTGERIMDGMFRRRY